MPAITQANFKKSYANCIKGSTNIIDTKVLHLRKTSKTSIQEQPPTFLKKLELLHPSHAWEIANKSPVHYKTNINR